MSQNPLSVCFGKSLTTNAFSELLDANYKISFEYNCVVFDISLIEWVSLNELLILIKWINNLSIKGCKIEVIFPYDYFIDAVDEHIENIEGAKSNLKPMYRRKRVLSFLERIGFNSEINRILGRNFSSPIHIPAHDDPQNEIFFTDLNDPHDVTILPIKSFVTKKDIDIKKDLSSHELRKLLINYSVLDYIDSGLLSDILIEELVANAIIHGSCKNEINNGGNYDSSSWISARLVKSSYSLVSESPKWLSKTFKSLIGAHYLEVTLCDSGPGVYDQLKHCIPKWLYKKTPTVKAALDYAFDKYSTSSNTLRTEHEALPRGLFWVHDLLQQYGGLIIIQSNGYYMGYDFLTKREHPRLLDLWNDDGACPGIQGTSIQLILPESKRIPIYIPSQQVKDNLREPVVFLINPPNYDENTKDKAQIIAKEIEQFCFGGGNFLIYVDFMSFDFREKRHRLFFANLIRYILFFQKPQLFWLLAPKDKDVLSAISTIIASGGKNEQTSEYDSIFENFSSHDKRIIPATLSSGEIYWLGATKEEIKCLNLVNGAVESTFEELGEEYEVYSRLALCNPNLVALKSNESELSKSILTLNYDLYNVVTSLDNIITNISYSIIRHTQHTFHLDGCYHLPHGKYSNYYLYIKPALMQNDITIRLSRYLITKILFIRSQSIKSLNIDTVIGGTHSAKRLIHQIANELSADSLTIDRYIDQINEPSIEPKVANKNIVIITDVMSSGRFVYMMAEKLIKYGARIEAICAIADLREEYSDKIHNIPVISLFHFPVKRQDNPSREPIYEINPISLRPTILEEERKRSKVPYLLKKDELIELINNSNALVPAHTILGPTHYVYFVDTFELLQAHAPYFFSLIESNITNILSQHSLDPSKDLSALITADGSNAELFIPDLIMKKYPKVKWLQIDRIRLAKESIWQLDRLDERLDPIDAIKNSVVVIWDDGSNTGNTMTQLIDIVSEFNPKIIFVYCLINRQPPSKSLFLNRINTITNGPKSNDNYGSTIYVQYIGTLPISTFVKSNCPICNHKEISLPPITEIENYWNRFRERTKQNRWNHISARGIRESAYGAIEKAHLGDVQKFIELVFNIRCSLGVFENTIGTTTTERNELLSYLQNYESIIGLAYIFHIEPQLLESVINFQSPEFKDLFFKSIINILNKTDKIFFGENILVEFVAEANPYFICDNLEIFIQRIIKTRDAFDIVIARMINQDELSNSIELINYFLEKLQHTGAESEVSAYARGLCNASLSWLRIKQSEANNDDLLNAITELQEFYREVGKPHGQAKDYSGPLDRILNIVERFQKYKKVPDSEIFNSVYRDWRDYTVKQIENRLIPALTASNQVLSKGIFIRRYFYNKDSGIRRDYLSLQKDLLELREADNKQLLLEEKSNQIVRATRRIYDHLFAPKKSPIASIVNKIPVFIVKHIEQRLSNYQWINSNNIAVDFSPPSSEIHGFMSSYIFKEVLDGIFSNIQKRNFRIDKNFNNENYSRIVIDITEKESKVFINIMSNGMHKYEDIPSHGIRSIREKCESFNGSYEICNDVQWVKNHIMLRRF